MQDAQVTKSLRLIQHFQELWQHVGSKLSCSVSARAEFLGIIYDPLFENLGSLANLEGQNFFVYNNFSFVCACVDIKCI